MSLLQGILKANSRAPTNDERDSDSDNDVVGVVRSTTVIIISAPHTDPLLYRSRCQAHQEAPVLHLPPVSQPHPNPSEDLYISHQQRAKQTHCASCPPRSHKRSRPERSPDNFRPRLLPPTPLPRRHFHHHHRHAVGRRSRLLTLLHLLP